MKRAVKMYVDCANCAAKVESAISKIAGVNSARVNFMTQRLILDVEEGRWDEIIAKAKEVGKKIDSDTEIYA